MKKILLIIIAIIGLQSLSLAQDIEAKATIASSDVQVGKPFTVDLTLKVPYGYFVEWNAFDMESLSDQIDIIKRGEVVRTADADSNVIVTQQLSLMTFDTGYVEVPEIPLTYAQSAETQRLHALTNTLMLHSTTISVDPSQPYKPIVPPMSKPFKFRDIWPYILAAVVLMLLIVAVVLLVKRHKAKEPKEGEKEEPKNLIPPYDKAISDLAELKQQKLWQAGKQKEYYSTLTDIVREYIEGQFGVNAVEMTTDEILEAIEPLNFDGRLFESFKDTMQLADFVKFAKCQPTSLENDMAMNSMTDFVNESYAHYQDMQQKNVNAEGATKEVNDVVE